MVATRVGAAQHPVGSIVSARGRDWVVLPSTDADVLMLRPLSGGDEEPTGLFLPLEGAGVHSSSFAPPDPSLAGDATGADSNPSSIENSRSNPTVER